MKTPKFLAIFNDNKEIIYSTWYTDAEQKAEFDLSFGIAERISEILKAKGLTQKDFARLLNKRDSEISKWLTGRHNFTTQTIARIETALGSKLISIAHWLGYANKHILKHQEIHNKSVTYHQIPRI